MLASLVVLLGSCGELYEADEEGGETIKATVTLSQTTLSLMVGDEYKIGVTLSPDTLKNKALFWESADTKVVSMQGDTLRAVAPGETTVTVSWPSQDVSGQATVTVLPVWQMATVTYPYDMLVFASVTVNGRAADDDCVVAVFDEDGNLRGVAQPRTDDGISYMLLRVYSPDGMTETLFPRCYDRTRALVSEAETTLTFSANSLGALSDLYKIEFE